MELELRKVKEERLVSNTDETTTTCHFRRKLATVQDLLHELLSSDTFWWNRGLVQSFAEFLNFSEVSLNGPTLVAFLHTFKHARDLLVLKAGFILCMWTLKEAIFAKPLITDRVLLCMQQSSCYLLQSASGFMVAKIHSGRLHFCRGGNAVN